MKSFIIFFILIILNTTSANETSQCHNYKLTPFHKDIIEYRPLQDFNKHCIDYGIDSILKLKVGLAQCQDSEGEPVNGRPEATALPPCLDNGDYQEVTYKSIQIVADCLDIPIKEILPKIKGESGFLHNALGKNYDAGIGQLTGSALKDVSVEMPSVKSWIESQSQHRPACKILLGKWNQLSAISSTGVNNRCEFLNWPLNPLKNILWTAVFLKRLRNLTSSEMETHNIVKKMLQAGLQQEDKSNMLGLITNLSYNSGSRSAVVHLSQYLDKKIALGIQVSKQDFNFKENLLFVTKELPFSTMSFPAYIKIHLGSGYLSGLMKQIYDYNNNVGSHLCTPEYIEGFLAL